MKLPDSQDWLDELLTSDEGYIEDNGFTVGVLDQLPSQRRSYHRNRSLGLLGAVLIAGIMVAGVDGGRSLSALVTPLLRIASLPESAALGTAAVMLLALIWIPLTIAFEED